MVNSRQNSKQIVLIRVTDSTGYLIDRMSESCHLVTTTSDGVGMSGIPCDRLAANLPEAQTYITWTPAAPPAAAPAGPPPPTGAPTF